MNIKKKSESEKNRNQKILEESGIQKIECSELSQVSGGNVSFNYGKMEVSYT
ncbi:MAG: hypothetical protein AAF757_12590 [Cyanobacteria bacterium P01_D01_bin.116]